MKKELSSISPIDVKSINFKLKVRVEYYMFEWFLFKLNVGPKQKAEIEIPIVFSKYFKLREFKKQPFSYYLITISEESIRNLKYEITEAIYPKNFSIVKNIQITFYNNDKIVSIFNEDFSETITNFYEISTQSENEIKNLKAGNMLWIRSFIIKFQKPMNIEQTIKDSFVIRNFIGNTNQPNDKLFSGKDILIELLYDNNEVEKKYIFIEDLKYTTNNDELYIYEYYFFDEHILKILKNQFFDLTINKKIKSIKTITNLYEYSLYFDSLVIQNQTLNPNLFQISSQKEFMKKLNTFGYYQIEYIPKRKLGLRVDINCDLTRISFESSIDKKINYFSSNYSLKYKRPDYNVKIIEVEERKSKEKKQWWDGLSEREKDVYRIKWLGH